MPPQLPLAYKARGAVTSTAKLLTSYGNASEAERLQPTRRMQRVAMLSAALQPSQYARLLGASGPRNQPGGCCIQYPRSICFVSCATWGSRCIHWNKGCCSWRLALSNLPPHVRLDISSVAALQAALHQHLKTRCIRVWLLLVCDFERSVFGAPEPAPRVFHFGPSCIAKAQRSLSVNSASSGLVCYCYCALTCHRLQDSSACRGFPAMVSCAEEAARKSKSGRFSLSEMQMTKAGVYASKEEGGRLRLQLPSTGLSVQTTEQN